MNERHLDPRAGAGGNIAEYTVSEISQAVRGTLESTFGRVRVRGEVGQSKQAASGHLYFNIKDADASMDAVAWRGTAQRLSVRLSEGMEIICTGRISSYPKEFSLSDYRGFG